MRTILALVATAACGSTPPEPTRPPAPAQPASKKLADPPGPRPDPAIPDRRPVDDESTFEAPDRGFAEDPRGDPYLRRLHADVAAAWDVPKTTIPKSPVGCMKLLPDGKIESWKLDQPSGNTDIDASVERALAAVTKQRAAKPEPVPTHLLKMTTKWICFVLR